MEISDLKQKFTSKLEETRSIIDKDNPDINHALKWLLPEMFANQVPKVVMEVVKMFLIDYLDCAVSEDQDYDCWIEDKRIKIATTIAHDPVPEPSTTNALMFFAEKQSSMENRIDRIVSHKKLEQTWTRAKWTEIPDYGYDLLLGCIILKDGVQIFAIPANKIKTLNVDMVRQSTVKAYSTINDVEFDVKKVSFYDVFLDSPQDRAKIGKECFIGSIRFTELCWATQTEEEILEFLRYMLNQTNIAGRMPASIRNILINTIKKYVEEKNNE